MINLIKLTDSQDKALGLQYATELPIGVGLLFMFSDTMPKTFHMRNVSFPIQMIAISEDMVVLDNIDAKPGGTEYTLPDGTHYVIEVNEGVGDGQIVVGEPLPKRMFQVAKDLDINSIKREDKYVVSNNVISQSILPCINEGDIVKLKNVVFTQSRWEEFIRNYCITMGDVFEVVSVGYMGRTLKIKPIRNELTLQEFRRETGKDYIEISSYIFELADYTRGIPGSNDPDLGDTTIRLSSRKIKSKDDTKTQEVPLTYLDTYKEGFLGDLVYMAGVKCAFAYLDVHEYSSWVKDIYRETFSSVTGEFDDDIDYKTITDGFKSHFSQRFYFIVTYLKSILAELDIINYVKENYNIIFDFKYSDIEYLEDKFKEGMYFMLDIAIKHIVDYFSRLIEMRTDDDFVSYNDVLQDIVRRRNTQLNPGDPAITEQDVSEDDVYDELHSRREQIWNDYNDYVDRYGDLVFTAISDVKSFAIYSELNESYHRQLSHIKDITEQAFIRGGIPGSDDPDLGNTTIKLI